MPSADPKPATFAFVTQLVCQELMSGDHLVFPVANPALASYGSTRGACLSELRLYLEDYLSQAEPEVLARFSLPKGVKLLQVEVKAPRQDLPKKLQIAPLLTVFGVAVPQPSETWVFLPALDHTVHVSGKQELLETIRAEAERLIAGREPDAAEWLRMLPPRSQALEEITLQLQRRDTAWREKARAARKKLREKLRREEAQAVLASVATAFHEQPEARDGPELVGRERELTLLTSLLSSSERTGVALVGDELAGKTALLYAYLRQEKKAGRERLVYATSGARLIAGMSGLGQWQERVQRVMRAAEELDALIYFENFGELLAQHSTDAINIPGAIKRFLEDGKVRVAGELAPESLDLLESRHPAFFTLLSRIFLHPLDLKSTAEALRRRVAHLGARQPERPNLAPDAVQPLLDLTERYLPYRALPGKAIRLYEELRAAYLNDREPDGTPRPITREKVLAALSLRTGIPEFLLRDDRALKADEVSKIFTRQLIGQKAAVRRVVETLCVVKAGLQPQGKPLATFLFVGPTGVGKTELARLLASFLFGSPDRMFRFDMSEYMDAWSAERLIRGSDRSEGMLTRRVRQQPFCVLLLDEIEKAHPAVFDLLLQVCGEGRLTDVKGRTAFFHNAIIIMTSNLGASHRTSSLGIGASSTSDEAHFLKEVQRAFRPEFVNRLDQIIPFHPLRPDEVVDVARLVLAKIRERRGLQELALNLEVDEPALQLLARDGYAEAYGARAMRRHVEDALVAPLSRLVAGAGGFGRGGSVKVGLREGGAGKVKEAPFAPGTRFSPTLEAGKLRLDFEPRSARSEVLGLQAVNEIRALRRQADRQMTFEPVEQIGEALQFLVSQLAGAGKESNQKPAAAKDIVRMQTDHHRLEALHATATELQELLVNAEELALSSFFEGEEPASILEEAREASARFRTNLLYLLLAQEKHRDEVTLLLQEPDEGRASELYLLPLLGEASRRKWSFTFHAEGESDPQRPKERRWGPARDQDWARRHLGESKRGFRNLLVHVRGPYAGVMLALEAGLHRWTEVHPKVNPMHLVVKLIAMRAELSDEELLKPVVRPVAPPSAKMLHAQVAVREHFGKEEKSTRLCGRRVVVQVPRGEYGRRLEEIILAHVILHEEASTFDRTVAFSGVLDLTAAGKEVA